MQMETDMKKLLIVAALTLLAGCGEPSSQSTGGQATTETASKPLAVGQTGKGDEVEITLTSAEATRKIGPAQGGIRAEPGETFVVANYTLKNVSDKPLGLLDRPTFTLIDDKGNSYAVDEMVGAMAGLVAAGDSMPSIDLNPGTSTKVSAAWKIAQQGFDPKTWKIEVATDPKLTFSIE
jgi:hypothetical protein